MLTKRGGVSQSTHGLVLGGFLGGDLKGFGIRFQAKTNTRVVDLKSKFI
jgi:hypothetical protein